MLTSGKIAPLDAQAFFADVMQRHGWTLEQLAEEAGYRLETLQKAARPGSGVKLSEKMRAGIENASRKATQTRNFAPALLREEMSPPHSLPAQPSWPRTQEADPPISHQEYTEAVHILGTLMEKNPTNFRVALATLRAMRDHLK